MKFTELTHKGLHKRVLQILEEIPSIDIKNQKILDIGCGNGNFLHELSKIGSTDLHACDGFLVNPKLAEFATFTKQNLNSPLQYDDNTFDIILFTEVVEHLENPNILLHEIHRILRKDGILILSTPNIFTIISRLLFLVEGTFFQFRKSDVKTYDFPGHISPFIPYAFAEIFREKFRIQKIEYSNFIVPILGWEIPVRNRYFGNTIILIIEKM